VREPQAATYRISARPSRADIHYEPDMVQLHERLERLWRQRVDEVTDLTLRLHDVRAEFERSGADGRDGQLTGLELEEIEARLEATRFGLSEADAALQRVAKGTFGFCGHCGGTIATDRLTASPVARLCASCQFWSRSG
jgi:RNA polymerase-binding transcription factor DksA